MLGERKEAESEMAHRLGQMEAEIQALRERNGVQLAELEESKHRHEEIQREAAAALSEALKGSRPAGKAQADGTPAGASDDEVSSLRQDVAGLALELSSARDALSQASEASSRATDAAASELQLLRHELNAVTWQLEESRAECKELAEEVRKIFMLIRVLHLDRKSVV
jgi:chromosome segregation ATPase